jgi:hypothetical protein
MGVASVPTVVFVADVMFDGCGFTVNEIPHILGSVVLIRLSFDNGLLVTYCIFLF